MFKTERSGGLDAALKNVGVRPARYVNMEPQPSFQKNFHLQFGQILAILPNGFEGVPYSVTDRAFQEIQEIAPAKRIEQPLLLQFLRDVEKHDDPLQNAALIWWDIPIKFRDTDESVKEEITRLCFDVERGVLYATVPPYTERGFTQRPSLSLTSG
jgi:hypothetical protein